MGRGALHNAFLATGRSLVLSDASEWPLGLPWIPIGSLKFVKLMSYITVRNLGCGSVRFRSDTFQISKNPKSSCALVVSPRGSSETRIGPQKLRA